tara:strand:- start:317 stop:589 length:273 start_codon:yes stop_codon:yes gene_type:complete
MTLYPEPAWVQVELSFDKKDESPYTIALPDDYKPAEKPYKAVSVVADFLGKYKHGDVVVVPTHIIREIDLSDNKFYLVERNHIMAAVRAE